MKGIQMKNLIAAAVVAVMATTATARDNIQIAGSSTVLPYASIVAEAFGENFNYPTPVVESGGSGAGRKRMCEGLGTNTIDIANSSSIMKEDEWVRCETALNSEVKEVRIGYDGIVFAAKHENKGFEALTEEQLYHALKADSPYTNWNQIDPSLPDTDILVFLPGTKHGTREVFEKKVMVVGCKAAGEFDKTLEKKPAEKACMKVRRDGLSVDIDGDYTETLASMEANKGGIGVFGLSFLLNNMESIYAADISGVEASTETIASGEYPISRPLQFYVKLAHIDVIPGMREYIEFFVSDEIAGPDGPLAEYGLVSDPELAKTQEQVSNF
jgi:phosphate transport system substrate-binding protein